MTNPYSANFTNNSKPSQSEGLAETQPASVKAPSYRRLSLSHQLSLLSLLTFGDLAILAFALLFFFPLSLEITLAVATGIMGYALLWVQQIRKSPATFATKQTLKSTSKRIPFLILPVVILAAITQIPPFHIGAFALVVTLGISAWHTAMAHALNTFSITAYLQEQLLLIGDHKDLTQLLNKTQKRRLHSHFVGYYSLKQENGTAIQGIPCLGTISEIAFLRCEHPIDAVVVVGNTLDRAKQRHVLQKLAAFSCPLYRCLVPVFNTQNLTVSRIRNPLGTIFGSTHVTLLRDRTLSLRNQYLKRAFDIVASSIALLVFSPLLIAAAVAVKVNSKGSILFRQQRWGLNGKVFHIYKFRSMYQHTCDNGNGTVVQAKKRDTRITSVGCVLRSTSIDELPQLFNVLKGDMSLIGPRPHAVGHNEYYAPKIRHYISRHRVKPGLSGLAQVHGYRGETPKLEQMHKRVSYDTAYIRRWSVWLDMQIIFRTVQLVLKRQNAH
jgi:putative colanic acid biosynthesis UDP-glucose lipid carrier transferase